MCKNCDNSQEHVINECGNFEKSRTKLIKELNNLDMLLKIKYFWTLFSIGIIAKTKKIKKVITKV